MPYPWPKHPSTPETIWSAADKIEKPAGDYENLATNVWREHGPAREGVAGALSAPMDEIPEPTRKDALQLIQAAIVGAAATRQFGDAIVIFDQEVEELNHQYENAKEHDFYDSTAKSTENQLEKRYQKLLDERDDEADESKAMLEKDPSETDLKKWVKAGILPPGAAAAFPAFDFTGLPQFDAWRKGYDFPTGGEQRRTWATFFGPGPLGGQSVTAQVGEPGEDHGIIYGRFFISKNDAAWPADLLGDDRGFTADPDADYRMAFAYNTATGEISYTVSGSTTTGGEAMDARDLGYTRGPAENAFPSVVTLPDGRIKISIHGVNPQTPAGAVDTNVTIDPDENYARVQGDDYPDVEIYRQNPDGSTTTIGRDEMSWWDGMATLPPFTDRDHEWGVPEDERPGPTPGPTPGPEPTPDPTPAPEPDDEPMPEPSPSPGPSPAWPPPDVPDWEPR